MRRKILYGLLIVVLGGAAYLVFLAVKASNEYDQSCKRISRIAGNEEKLNYIDGWIETKLADEGFLELAGRVGKVRLLDSPQLDSQLDIDWEYLGLRKAQGFVALNRWYRDWDHYLDPNTVKSVSIGYGRSSLIINVNDLSELGLEWPAGTLERIQPISERVSIFCN